MMSRGKGAPPSKSGIEDIYGAGNSRGKPGVGSLNSGNNRPQQINNSVTGAGYNSKAPYLGAKGAGPGGAGLNAFNIPKYGQLGGGLGGIGSGIGGSGIGGGVGAGAGIGGGIGSYGSLGGGLSSYNVGSAGSYNKQSEEGEFGGRYK